MKQKFEIGDDIHEVTLVRSAGGIKLVLDGSEHTAVLSDLGDGQYRIDLDGAGYRVHLVAKGDETYIHADGANWTVRQIDPLDALSAGAAGADVDTVESPMPGTVIRVTVKAGDEVKKFQTMMVIESMKMETSINAWRDGVVARVHCEQGSTFDRKAPLVTLQSIEQE